MQRFGELGMKAERNRPRQTAATVILILILAALSPLSPTNADSITDLAHEIPDARDYTASVLAGADIYTFGAHFENGTSGADVLKYAPAAGGNATKVADLPFGIDSVSAIWNGSAAFIFGGNGDGDRTRIVRYNQTDGTSDVVAHFSSARAFTSAVWTGTHAYIFGGVGAANVPEVVKFNTTSFELETVVSNNATINRSGTSAVWDGASAYIFAGTGCPAPPQNFCNNIVRFSPSDNNAIAVMGATFPLPRTGTAATWDGLAAYIFGTGQGTTDIFRYRPATDTLTKMNANLTSARKWTNAVWNGTFVYVLTGSSDDDWPKKIVQYNLTPGKPETLNASSDINRPAEIRLNWTPPAANTYTYPITNYTVYRGLLGQAETFLVTLGNVTSYTDTAVDRGSTYCYKVYATNAQGDGPPRPGPQDLPVCAPAY